VKGEKVIMSYKVMNDCSSYSSNNYRTDKSGIPNDKGMTYVRSQMAKPSFYERKEGVLPDYESKRKKTKNKKTETMSPA
jgi:hypothetical protein